MEELNICEPEDHNWEIYETDVDWLWTHELGSNNFTVYRVRCTTCRAKGLVMPSNRRELEAVRQIVDVTVSLDDNTRVKTDRGWSDLQARVERVKLHKKLPREAPLQSSTRLQELLESQPN